MENKKGRIFISYRRSDAAGHARLLYRELLERFGEGTIFFDRASIDSGDRFPERLQTAIQECAVLLALIGPDWIDIRAANGSRRLEDPTDFVRQEIALALALHKSILPILFDDTPMPTVQQLPQPLSRLPDYDALTLGGKTYEYDAEFAELLRLLSNVSGMPKPRSVDRQERVHYRLSSYLLSEHFFGRETELAELAQILGMPSADEGRPPATICGMGGSGKTQLALKYSIEHQRGYAGIWWFRSERTGTLEADFEAFCVDLDIARTDREKPHQAAARWLAGQDTWLLVFDNAESLEAVRPYVKPFRDTDELRRHQILITSRDPNWGALASVLKLEPWDTEPATAFLETRLHNGENEDLTSLAIELGGLPLALAQAAAYIEETGIPVAEYNRLLKSPDAGQLLDKGQVGTGYEQSVIATLSLAFQRLSEAGRELLRLCAWFGPEAIPLRLFADHADRLPPALGEACATPLGWNDTIAELLGYSLASRVRMIARGKTVGDGLQFHRLTQQAARLCTAEPEDANSALVLLNAALPADIQDPSGWSGAMVLFPHLLRIADAVPSIDSHLARASLQEAASVAINIGLTSEVDALMNAALSLRDSDRQDEETDDLSIMGNRASAFLIQGDLASARSLQEQILESAQIANGVEDPLTLGAMLNLASTLKTQGDYSGALELERQVVETRQRLLGEENNDTLRAMNNLAETYRLLKDPINARKLHEQVLSTRSHLLGSEDARTIRSMVNLAGVLQELGDRPSARALYEQALELRVRIHGPTDRQTTSVAWSLFKLLLELQDGESARAVLADHLAWLVNADSESLSPEQSLYRERLLEFFEASQQR